MSKPFPIPNPSPPPKAVRAALWALLGVTLILAAFLSASPVGFDSANSSWRGAEMLAAADAAPGEDCSDVAGYGSAHHCCSDAACMAAIIVAPMAIQMGLFARADGGDLVSRPVALAPPTFFHPPIPVA